MNKIFPVILLLFIATTAFADQFADQDEIVRSREIPDLSSYKLTNTNYTQIGYDAKVSFANPFSLQAEFFYINMSQSYAGTLETKLTGALTPITASAAVDYAYTAPIPLLQLNAGLLVGSGWPLPGYGNGIGMQSNFYDSSIQTNAYSQEILSKQYLRFYGGTGLQFDLASIFPGAWNHLQIRTYQELYYQYFLGATSETDVYMYDNVPDKLKNLRYYGSYYIGYEMPFFLRRIGFLYEIDLDVYRYSDSTIASGGWGSDFIWQTLGFIQTFAFDKEGNLTLDFMVQWGNYIVYRPGYDESVTLMNRQVDPNYYQFWRLRQVYLALTEKF